jgi:hypothetical protein
LPNLRVLTLFGNQLYDHHNEKSNTDDILTDLKLMLGIIKTTCPNIQLLSLDGNPITAYLDKEIYNKTTINIIGPTLSNLDGTEFLSNKI